MINVAELRVLLATIPGDTSVYVMTHDDEGDEMTVGIDGIAWDAECEGDPVTLTLGDVIAC